MSYYMFYVSCFFYSVQCPPSVQASIQRNRDDFEDYNNPTETPTEKSLIRLHKRVIKASQTYRRTQCQWHLAIDKACELEDIKQNETNPQHVFVRSCGSYEGMFSVCYNASIG